MADCNIHPENLTAEMSADETEGFLYFLTIMGWVRRSPSFDEPDGNTFDVLRDSDIIVNAVPKSGTTLVQQICYQIAVASGGASEKDKTGTNFNDFNEVCPWLECMSASGTNPCETKPRVFKSHLTLQEFPRELNAKHIIVMRNPCSFPSSLLDFVFDSVIPNADQVTTSVREATFKAMVKGILIDVPDIKEDILSPLYFYVVNHLKVEREQEQRVLVLCYEDIVDNLQETVVNIAKFMGCEISEQGLKTVMERCDRDYMASRQAFGLISEAKPFNSQGKSFMKVKVARSTGFKQFSVDEKYLPLIKEMNKAVFGFADYDDFRASIKERMKRVHHF